MPLQVWYDLILNNHIGLVGLIMVRRTCRSFATYKKLNDLIKLKIDASFSKIKKDYWNKTAKTNNSKIVTSEFTSKHPGKFLYIEQNGYYKLGAFSSKSLLFDQFLRNYESTYGKYSTRIHILGSEIRFNSGASWQQIYTGINTLILDFLSSHPNKVSTTV